MLRWNQMRNIPYHARLTCRKLVAGYQSNELRLLFFFLWKNSRRQNPWRRLTTAHCTCISNQYSFGCIPLTLIFAFVQFGMKVGNSQHLDRPLFAPRTTLQKPQNTLSRNFNLSNRSDRDTRCAVPPEAWNKGLFSRVYSCEAFRGQNQVTLGRS